MAIFISKTDPVQLLGDEETCNQIIFDEGQFNTRKLCSECDVSMALT